MLKTKPILIFSLKMYMQIRFYAISVIIEELLLFIYFFGNDKIM